MSIKVKQKIFLAQEAIKKSDLKKKGRNNYSNFDYYTPEQISQLVDEACRPLSLMNEFDMVKTDNTLTGFLTITDLESGEEYKKSMPMEIPTIKATNTVQQLGGALTYTRRYMYQNLYDIADNSVDPDANQRPDKKPAEKKPDLKKPQQKPASKFSIAEFKQMTESKKVLYLSDLLVNNHGSRIPEALKFCEENKYLSELSIMYVEIITHTFNIQVSERVDYIISLFKNPKSAKLVHRVLIYVSKFNLLNSQEVKNLRLLLNTK